MKVESGAGPNMFANPEQIYNSFRQVNLSSTGRAGRANPTYGIGRWNIDMSLGKKDKDQ